MKTPPKQLEIFLLDLEMRRIAPEKNMRRFYLLTVQRDLFGGATLTREWGRIGSAGQVKVTHHGDEGQAVDALASVQKSELKRGYSF